MADLHFDYTASRAYAKYIGLQWLGDDYALLIAMDDDAKKLGMTQEQVDAGMRHHLWQVKILFDPAFYNWKARLALAFHFLFGRSRKQPE